MKVKLDENLPHALAELLRAAGHDVATVLGEGLGGLEDPHLAEIASSEDRVLMTFDLDFADVRHYPIGSHAGIVVFRLRDQRWSALEGPARHLSESGVLSRLQGGLAIVDEFAFEFAGIERTSEGGLTAVHRPAPRRTRPQPDRPW